MELSLASAKPSPRAAAAAAAAAAASSSLLSLRGRRRRVGVVCAAVSSGEEVFGGRRELAGVQPLVEALPPVARAVVELAVVAAAAAAGYVVGLRAGGTRTTAVAGAAALGAVSVAGAAAVNSAVPGVAAAGLHNYVAGSDDPTKLESSEVEAIASKYGVSTEDATFKAELCDLYGRFVFSLIHPGYEDLEGTEVETIIKFKKALGLNDIDAANVHMEIAKRIDRNAGVGQQQAFEKLIFVTNLVFRDAYEYLLPWKRLFGVHESQIDDVMRESAKSLYASLLKSIGRGLDIGTLIEVRRSQLAYKLSDEIAAEMFREHAKKLVEENISTALNNLNNRTQVVEEVKSILSFNGMLTVLSNFPGEERFVRGLGPITLGGDSDHEKRVEDLKMLYSAYAMEVLSDGHLNDDKLAALNQLRNIFGLAKYEAEAIITDVKARVFQTY
uniref:Chloroplast inner envelope protein n=1 Tax=Oryza nivara TaxID=4536 RepID=A0A0E0IUD7_ORYNI